MHQPSANIDLDLHVAKTLLYFDIFNYPLRRTEVYRFLGVNSVSENDVQNALDALAEEKFIFRFGEFYCMHNDDRLIMRRELGNKRALEYHDLAMKQAKLIAKFPFVRAVMASGSLSKDYMDDNCDLDFFIVTTPGRLWVCRTILVLYKRLFLHNSHKLFCVNYFIDEAHLEIEEKNLFTATELATVLPLYGGPIYEKLMTTNHGWVKTFLPNFKTRDVTRVNASKMNGVKAFCERILNTFFPEHIDRWCMQTTLKRWERLYGSLYSESDFKVAFKTLRHASKNHPRNFQKSVMALYQQKVAAFHDTFYRSANS